MADKAINDLVQASQITDDDLFVLQQQGAAKKLKGKTLLEFLTFNVLRVSVACSSMFILLLPADRQPSDGHL